MPFPLRRRPSFTYMSSFPTKYPHKSKNPTTSSSHICSTRALIVHLLQFLYVDPITGKIPERIICSTVVFFSFPTNCLYLCSILVFPSLSALFVPICTNIDNHWSCSNVFSTLSVTCSILAPGRQTTTYSPLLNVLSVFRKMGSPINTRSVLNAPQSLLQSSSSVLRQPGR